MPNLLLHFTIIFGSGQVMFHNFCEGEAHHRSTPWGAYRTQAQWSFSIHVSRVTFICWTYSDSLQVFFIVHPLCRCDSTSPALTFRGAQKPLSCSYHHSGSGTQKVQSTHWQLLAGHSSIQVLTGLMVA